MTLHLLFGMTTLALLWWLWLNLDAQTPRSALPALGRSPGVRWAASNLISRRLALVGLVALALQIALGGWTSTNYAAIACPDFPTCQAAWWPDMDFGHAFVLWHAPTMNYEGGVLGNTARVAIHFTHRLGAGRRDPSRCCWRRCGSCARTAWCVRAPRPSPSWPHWPCS